MARKKEKERVKPVSAQPVWDLGQGSGCHGGCFPFLQEKCERQLVREAKLETSYARGGRRARAWLGARFAALLRPVYQLAFPPTLCRSAVGIMPSMFTLRARPACERTVLKTRGQKVRVGSRLGSARGPIEPIPSAQRTHRRVPEELCAGRGQRAPARGRKCLHAGRRRTPKELLRRGLGRSRTLFGSAPGGRPTFRSGRPTGVEKQTMKGTSRRRSASVLRIISAATMTPLTALIWVCQIRPEGGRCVRARAATARRAGPGTLDPSAGAVRRDRARPDRRAASAPASADTVSAKT